MIRKIEIDFALPVELTDKEAMWLDKFVGIVCKRHCPEGWAFWPAGYGSKPCFSKADGAFLGAQVSEDAPDSGEPTWDDSVYSIDCAARELYPEEIEKRKAEAVAAEARKARWDSRLAGWLHGRGFKRASWWVADVSFWFHTKRRAP